MSLILLTWVFCNNLVKIHSVVVEILSFSCSVLLLVKPQSHRTKFPLRQCKTGLTQYKLVRRRRNAVQTDKDVMRSLWSWLRANFEHVQKIVVRT